MYTNTTNNIDILKLWKITLNKFKNNIKNTTINQYYLNEIEFKEIDKNFILLIVKDNYIKWILNKYIIEFEKIICKVFETNLKILFLTPKEYQEKKENKKIENLNNIIFDIENLKKNINIIPEYNFKTFLRYENNKIAFNSAYIISEKFNQDWNPLYIFGDTGVGKTHLLHSIANELIKNGKKPILINSDIFLLLFTSNITKQNKNNLFFEKFLNFIDEYDIFLIDDIQFLNNKKKTIEFFFFIFNWFVNKKKQIVIVSDRLPSQLKNISERLISRFQNGLIVNIKQIDKISSIKLLKLKIKEYKIFKLDEEVYEYIANNFNENVRQLLGCIKRIIFYSINNEIISNKGIINLEDSKKALSIFDKNLSTNKKIEKILDTIVDYFKIEKEKILSNNKNKNIVLIREIFIYILKNIENLKNKKISLFLNKKESQIQYSLKNIEKKIKKNKKILIDINNIKKII